MDSTEPNVLISVRNLNKEFHMGRIVVQALKDVQVEVYEGEYLSIMGPSGSGKTTLFNMVGALDRPTSGQVTVAGVDLTRLSAKQLAYFRGNHIGYVFQTYNLIPAYSAVDNVAMPLIFSGMPRDRAAARAEEVLGKVGLSHRLTHRPDELSGGQQQRVAIARALANEPAIILADEPTGNLDLHTGEEIIHLLHRLSKDEGVTVIASTHDYKMLDVSDRILWIKDGCVEKLQRRSELDIRIGNVT
jgi:putative ABC transport system ATP-binding protein